MAQERRKDPGRGGKVHPLFIELYLRGDLDDSPAGGKRNRKRGRRVLVRKTAIRPT
jgi:hypothetical protein